MIAATTSFQQTSGKIHGEFAQYKKRNAINSPKIDNFLAHWQDKKSHKVFGSLEVWDILTKLEGSALKPKRKGAVLIDLNSVSYAELKKGATTRKSSLTAVQHVWYVASGEGLIKSGRKSEELFEGKGVIIPPKVMFTLENTGSDPLTFYIIEEPIPSGFRPRKSIVVKYEFDNPVSSNVRRVENSDWLFSRKDGLAVLFSFNPVMYEPQSLVPPHVHGPGIEEVWIGLNGDMGVQIGSQRRPFPKGSVYKVPADGRTPHTNINASDVSKKLLWMMKIPLPEGYDQERNKGDMI